MFGRATVTLGIGNFLNFINSLMSLLWPPYVADADKIFLSCLWSSYGIGQTITFFPIFLFFPRCKQHAGNTGRKNDAKIAIMTTRAQLRRSMSSQLRHTSTIGKKRVKQQYLPQTSLQYAELRPTNGCDRLAGLRHSIIFQRVSRLDSVTARQSSIVGVRQTLRRWTEGATCVRQGNHRVGHWPTF